MDIETLAIAHQKTEDRSLRNEGRIKKLEDAHEVLHTLATSVAVMAEKMDVMNKSVESLTNKVEEIESRPAEHWNKLITSALAALAGAFITWLISGAPNI